MSRFFTFALVTVLASSAFGEAPKEIRNRGITATIRVTNGPDATGGSGVLFAHQGPHAYVLTAQHVVPKADVVDVTISGSKPIRADVIARSAEADLAVLRFPAPDSLPTPVSLATAASKLDQAVSVGWEKGERPTALEETVKGKVRLRRPGESKAVQCWETIRKPANGRSGGPLLDQAGAVTGIASGHDGEVGYYVHIDEIRAFLRANALRWLAEEDR